MLLKLPIPPRVVEALEKVLELALKFVKELWHVPYKVDLQQLRLFSLSNQRIHGDLISIFKVTRGLLEFDMGSTFTHPTSKELRGHAYRFHQQ